MLQKFTPQAVLLEEVFPRTLTLELPLTSIPMAWSFVVFPSIRAPIVERYRRFLADNGIGIAGIEFIVDRAGELYTYDVNTNTNYNGDAERAAGVSGMRAIAAYLGDELRALDARRERAAA